MQTNNDELFQNEQSKLKTKKISKIIIIILSTIIIAIIIFLIIKYTKKSDSEKKDEFLERKKLLDNIRY